MVTNSIPRVSFALTINWKLLLLGLCFLPLLLRLGFWQLERAEEKRQLIELQRSQAQLSPLLLNPFDQTFSEDIGDHASSLEKQLAHRSVQVSGRFLNNHYWLLDNRIVQGKVGYEVIAPLTLDTGRSYLINRGWVAAPLSRGVLPQVDFPKGLVQVQGHWKLLEKNALIADVETTGKFDSVWPKRIQQVNHSAMAEMVGQFLHQGIVQIDPADKLALTTLWRDVNVQPQKHTGYAVQWFAMAFALLVLLVITNTNISRYLSSYRHQQQQSNHNNKGEAHER
ncbi:MAG: hypothetical protein CL693_14495 [Cellvibrionaceae bacterium]|nr:hypothetical protein [Cellvibrionaceae bacterium]|tara:strand:+ start:2016 stop:2861 length:846 start_codon:yes stop_codon:yes gene_type:complete